jgi:AraC-like DNA-binding protein
MKPESAPQPANSPKTPRISTQQRALKARALYDQLRKTADPITNKKYSHDEAIMKIAQELGMSTYTVRWSYLKDRHNRLSSSSSTLTRPASSN